MNGYVTANVAEKIRDYYSRTPAEVALGKTTPAFERAREEYIKAMESNLAAAKSIRFTDVFKGAKVET